MPSANPDPLPALARLEGVGSAMTAARDAADLLLRDRGLRRTRPDDTAESLLRGAHAAAALTGSTTSLEEMRAGEGDAAAQAALRVSVGVLGVVPQLRTSPLQALARLHALAASPDAHPAGRPDPSQLDDIGRPRGDEGAGRLVALGRLLQSDTPAPALVLAAVAHAEVRSVEPFAEHSAIVALALERAVLVSRGVDPASVTVPEAGHLALRAAYESNLRGYRDGGIAGVQGWLLYAAEAYTRGVAASPLADRRP